MAESTKIEPVKFEPIVLEYGKAKATIPVSAKRLVWAWLLITALALGVNAYQFWKQQQLESRLTYYAGVQELLVKQLRECLLIPEPKSQKPFWANILPSGMTGRKTCPIKSEFPLNRLTATDSSTR